MSSLYSISIPALIWGLKNLRHILTLAERTALSKSLDPQAYLSARLAPDMFGFLYQIQRVAMVAKAFPIRVLSLPLPTKGPDTETSFADLHTRVQGTIDFLSQYTEADFIGKEEQKVVLNWPGKDVEYTAKEYLLFYVVPNFWFHHSVAYAILRKEGVEVGKEDFQWGAGWVTADRQSAEL